jgi:hypothetical protein
MVSILYLSTIGRTQGIIFQKIQIDSLFLLMLPITQFQLPRGINSVIRPVTGPTEHTR